MKARWAIAIGACVAGGIVFGIVAMLLAVGAGGDSGQPATVMVGDSSIAPHLAGALLAVVAAMLLAAATLVYRHARRSSAPAQR